MLVQASCSHRRSANVGVVGEFAGGTLPRSLRRGDDLGDLGPQGSEQEQLPNQFAEHTQILHVTQNR